MNRLAHHAHGSKSFRFSLAEATFLTLALCSAASAVACTSSSPPPARAANNEVPLGAAEPPPVSVPSTAQSQLGSKDHEGPAQLLAFIGIGRGDRLADLGAGAGYSIAALAEAVGASGVVYARHDLRTPTDLRDSAERGTEDELPSNLILMRTPLRAPFAKDAVRLDEVTFFFGYHELVAEGGNRSEFNASVLRALKPGGIYVIGERAAPEGSGLGAAKFNRIEASLVRTEVEAAGFAFVEAADFSSREAGARTERAVPAEPSQYLLEFKKPR